jgi:glycosyltransferase involved in cell wall biosynthesis
MQGKPFLREQLDSIVSQTHVYWKIWVSDDGSVDGTLDILAGFQSQLGEDKFHIAKGPAKGFAKNFLSLVCNPHISAPYYGYSDQDDIWQPDKLARAVAWLESIPAHIPALYCTRTCNVDDQNQVLGLSPLFDKPPSFANALVQSIAGGNTMVFNHAARQLLVLAGADVQVVTHDWWTYLVVSGCGGQVFYDSQSAIRYRQHGGNLIGTNSSWTARLVRTGMLYSGRFCLWTDMNMAALQRLHAHLTADNLRLVNDFRKARASGLLTRLIGIWRTGIYRQTLMGNLGLIAAVVLNKI